MTEGLSRELTTDIRLAATAADHDGTAALNTLVFGGVLMIASSVALVAVGGTAGVFLWAFVWLFGVGSIAVWLAPHFSGVRRWRHARTVQRRALLDRAQQRAVDLLLNDDASVEQQRAAASLLAEATPRSRRRPAHTRKQRN